MTGANGLVGSHVIEALVAKKIPTVALLRNPANADFIYSLGPVEIRAGSLDDRDSLQAALPGVSHVVNCAGSTKARKKEDFFQVNQVGVRNLVSAVNAAGANLRRLVHISSLAAAGPATRKAPAREEHPARPVSEYGKSKLAGEREVLEQCRRDHVILRPPAVYGPRDFEFLKLFRAVKSRLLPGSASQDLSLVFVRDLAEAVVRCLEHPAAVGKLFYVSGTEVCTSRELGLEISRQMGVKPIPMPSPDWLMRSVCLAQTIQGWVTGKAQMLTLLKLPELLAPGWVCDSSLISREVDWRSATTLQAGIGITLAWYRQRGWL